MASGLENSLRIEQTLSAKMIQSLELLSMPVTDLRQRINEEIESNPALEIPDQEFDPNTLLKKKTGSEDDLPDDRLDDADSSVYEDPGRSVEHQLMGNSSYSGDPDAAMEALENTGAAGETLSEHLERQLVEIPVSDTVREIALALISNLDGNGFYCLSPEELFQDKGYKEEDIKSATDLVRSFDPYGICVKDFRESLVLQAKCRGLEGRSLKLFSSIVENHMSDLKNGKIRTVSQKLGCDESETETLWSFLKTLTPYPGSVYSTRADMYVVPEISIHRLNGELVLDLNYADIPPLAVSQEFCTLSDSAQDGKSRDYVKKYVNRAQDFISLVQMRYKTTAAAATVLMEEQKDFFIYGPSHLKILTLKTVAERTGVHESTMSRLAQSKYVDTDWGVFPLRYFFSQGVSSVSSDSGTLSRNAVKDIILKIIEEKGNISDQKISDILSERGIKCARRTVNKYRSELQGIQA